MSCLPLSFPEKKKIKKIRLFKRGEMQRQNLIESKLKKQRDECEDTFGFLSLSSCTGWSMGFISYFSVTPGIGFNCLNCRFPGNLYGRYESFLCLQSGKAEPGNGVGENRNGDERCGHHGSVRRVNVFLPPLQQMSLSIDLHFHSFLVVPPCSSVMDKHIPDDLNYFGVAV